jgi:hypothetical protein
MEPAASAPAWTASKDRATAKPTTGTTPDRSSCRRTRRPRTQVRLGARAHTQPPPLHRRERGDTADPTAQTTLDRRARPQVRLHRLSSVEATTALEASARARDRLQSAITSMWRSIANSRGVSARFESRRGWPSVVLCPETEAGRGLPLVHHGRARTRSPKRNDEWTLRPLCSIDAPSTVVHRGNTRRRQTPTSTPSPLDRSGRRRPRRPSSTTPRGASSSRRALPTCGARANTNP